MLCDAHNPATFTIFGEDGTTTATAPIGGLTHLYAFSDSDGKIIGTFGDVSENLWSGFHLLEYKLTDDESQTPEPATWVMLLGVFALALGYARPRRKI